MKEEEEKMRSRGRQCALSCLNKNKQLSKPIQTLEKKMHRKKIHTKNAQVFFLF